MSVVETVNGKIKVNESKENLVEKFENESKLVEVKRKVECRSHYEGTYFEEEVIYINKQNIVAIY